MPALLHIPTPDARSLLPSLLACLSTATASKQPPPALLPLLSPILRQRLTLLASDNWLALLSWDTQVASRLPQTISNIHVEPHPASGEIEVEEPDQILYRRSDPETLHSRLVLGEFDLIATYLWCTGGEEGDGWRLAELRSVQDSNDGTQWFPSIDQANEAGFQKTSSRPSGGAHQTPATTVTAPETTAQNEDDGDDDDAYWAAYDRTPGRTPQQKRSPAPATNSRVQIGPTQDELEYFARYAQEVQPALDAHDPDEEGAAEVESTLHGTSLQLPREPQTEPLATNLGPFGYDSSLPPAFTHPTGPDGPLNGAAHEAKAEHIENVEDDRYAALNHPRPSSSASSNSIERLEREAESHSQAELAIKQHISTDLKSLFRLARTAGIDREEFERIIRRELEVLPLLERDH
ncbi:hypothetical protein BU24DRAFT_427875 [Aaosphaeria arxii CBS 175.79]|uniref:Uncharacterized protein n=1 Tax=Aaosphaeria arxii CBS 175.79 TaxID=1450172 RepID=A0A6A5XAN3_9PLEO|nr:uncharacterized protein BU24DRAFT_427875 [Aaosphaeria arxii CBS 175.79]KAF2009847.1 hypothetical protein BU24DRAFT_427875 [Aaosphaeria arxii CBS 175.79]